MRIDIGDGVRLFVDVVGSFLEPTPERMVDRPALLLLHGGPEARENYESLFVRLETDRAARYLAENLPLYNRRESGFGPERTRMNFALLDHFTKDFGDMDLREQLGRITCPSLVLCGADDPMTPVVGSEEILDHLPGGLGRLEVFDDCGHGTFRDQPDRTEAVLRDFLASVAAPEEPAPS